MTTTPHIAPARISLTAGDNPLIASEIRLGAHPRGACIVVTDGPPGAVDEIGVMNELATHGYESITINSPQGPGGLEFIRAAVKHLAARGRFADNLGLLGLGAGGRSVLRAAATASFGAAVSISPTDGMSAIAVKEWLRAAPATTTLRSPWLGLLAEPDGDAIGTDIERFARALARTSPVHAHTVTYRRVSPDFYRNGNTIQAHAAAFEAWQRTVEWFNLQVAPTPADSAKVPPTTKGATP